MKPKVGDLVTCLDLTEKYIVEITNDNEKVLVSDNRVRKYLKVKNLEIINNSLWCEIPDNKTNTSYSNRRVN